MELSEMEAEPQLVPVEPVHEEENTEDEFEDAPSSE
jgi:hypothetical protein